MASAPAGSLICGNCGRANLPGGVRCIYCGKHYPAVLDFHIPAVPGVPVNQAAVSEPVSPPKRAKGIRGWLAALGAMIIKGKSLLALLKFGKIATTLISMLLFIAADSRIFGWKFGVGIALSIFVHEMGHVIVNWRKGLKQTAPMFIPFVGAVIFLKNFPEDPTIESESGAGGPVAGAIAALFCLIVGMVTHNPYWIALAHIGFLINLFNLTPFPPLDGSHIMAVFSPAIYSGTLIILLLWLLKTPNTPLLWLVLIVGFLFRLGHRDETRYQIAAPGVRIRMALIFLALCIGLSMGSNYASMLHSRPAAAAYAPSPPTPETIHPGLAGYLPGLPGESAEMVMIALFLGSAVAWLITGTLLSMKSGKLSIQQPILLAGAMTLLLAALVAASLYANLLNSLRWQPLYGFFTAAFAALCYAGYEAAPGRKSDQEGFVSLRARCLAWAAAGALLSAYEQNSAIVVVITALLTLIFYSRFPWALPSMIGRYLFEAESCQESVKWTSKAIALKPDPESLSSLQIRIALSYLILGKGQSAMEKLEECKTAGSQNGKVTADVLQAWVKSLILLGRYEEALSILERWISDSSSRIPNLMRLYLTHSFLADIALFRGWNDEAQAQISQSRKLIPSSDKSWMAVNTLMESRVLAQLGRDAEAIDTGRSALKLSRTPQLEAGFAAIETEIAIRENNLTSAERELARACKFLPGHLIHIYLQGKLLIAQGKTGEGAAILNHLAKLNPHDQYGRMAHLAAAESAS